MYRAMQKNTPKNLCPKAKFHNTSYKSSHTPSTTLRMAHRTKPKLSVITGTMQNSPLARPTPTQQTAHCFFLLIEKFSAVKQKSKEPFPALKSAVKVLQTFTRLNTHQTNPDRHPKKYYWNENNPNTFWGHILAFRMGLLPVPTAHHHHHVFMKIGAQNRKNETSKSVKTILVSETPINKGFWEGAKCVLSKSCFGVYI